MFNYNSQAREKSEEKITLEQDLNKLEAELAVANKSLIYAEEQINNARQTKNALIEGRNNEVFEKTKMNPQQVFLYDEGVGTQQTQRAHVGRAGWVFSHHVASRPSCRVLGLQNPP